MKKFLRCIVSLFAAAGMILSMSSGVGAVEENIEVTGASNIEFSMPSAPVFTAATHSNAINVGSFIGFSGSNDNLEITDATGTNSGWKFSLAVTDFYTQGIDDPTDSDSEDMDIFIAAGDWMSFSIDNSSEGIDCDGSYTLVCGAFPGVGETVSADHVVFMGVPLPNGTPHCSASAADTINVITVDPGFGAGRYVFDLNYKITIPEWLPVGAKIDSSASNGKRFDDMTIGASDKVQVFAGIYTTNIVYSVSCNPAS